MAVSTPKIDEIRARLLKIGDNGPLGITTVHCSKRRFSLGVVAHKTHPTEPLTLKQVESPAQQKLKDPGPT